MKAAELYVKAAAAGITAMQMTATQTKTTAVTPTRSIDPWECVAANLTQYFDVPKPTGSLLSAVYDYGREMAKSCTSTGIDEMNCPKPEKTKWCGLSTAVPQSLSSDYNSYASVASSWWFPRSESIALYSTMCPKGWSRIGPDGLYTWLNITNGIGECHAAAHPASGVSGKAKSGAPTGTNTGITTGIPTGTQAASGKSSNGFAPQRERMGNLMVVAAGFVGSMNW
jgi:hypothetical protein